METAKPAKLRLPVWLTDLLVTGLAYLQHTNESLSILRHLKPVWLTRQKSVKMHQRASTHSHGDSQASQITSASLAD